MSDEKIKQVARIIKNAKNIAVLTGAGVSKESGVPTFRDALEGLWSKYDPQQLATPQAFRQNPKLVWDWYQFRVGLVSEAKPNAGHYALAQIEQRFPTWVITQNVDALHEEAGSKNVIHLHGNLSQYKCFGNCQGEPTLIDIDSFEWDRENGPPKCPHCEKDYVRPNVVWFGEMLPLGELDKAKQISVECDVMIVVGTSGLVTPAASLPSYAKYMGVTIIEANPDYSMITPIADIKLDGPSGEMLPKVIEALDHA